MIREKFLRTIQKFRMIEKGDTVLVGVSGGCDSVVLFHLLLELQKDWKLKLGVLHANHQLRGRASDADERFVRTLARRVKVPVFVGRLDIKARIEEGKVSLEEAARELRYHFFEKTAQTQQAHKIAVAHTQDDQAETVLMRIITGTGLQGLQAIRPKRKLNGVYLVRPLVEIPKKEIREFAKANSIRFREDRSNRSLQFLRNRIRLKLLPFLERSFNPQVRKALARLPHLLDVDLQFLDGTAEMFYQQLVQRKHNNEITFPKPLFFRLHPSIQYRLINRAMRFLARTELDFEHWNLFLGSLVTKKNFQMQLPKGVLASVSSEKVRIHQGKKTPLFYSYTVSPGESVYVSEIDATLSCEPTDEKVKAIRKANRSFDVFDSRKLVFPLTIRNRQPGDSFQPLGQAKPLKLKGFLINRRVPVEERDRLPLVISGNQIAWVGKMVMAEPFKVTPQTKQFVRLALAPGNQT